MAYVTLGARTLLGAADTTGNNPGNWTVVFDPNAININEPFFECYKIVVTGAAQTATFNVNVNVNQWDTAVYATNNSWDPAQPLLLRPGDTLYFYYSSASSDGKQPKITAWFRYDPALKQIWGANL